MWTGIYVSVNRTYFTDVDIVQWIDSLAGLLDILSNGVGEELVHHFLQVGAGHITGNDVAHLLTDGADLRVLGVAGLALGQGVLSGESNAEHAQQVTIGGLDIDVGLNEGLPFLDHGTISGNMVVY